MIGMARGGMGGWTGLQVSGKSGLHGWTDWDVGLMSGPGATKSGASGLARLSG